MKLEQLLRDSLNQRKVLEDSLRIIHGELDSSRVKNESYQSSLNSVTKELLETRKELQSIKSGYTYFVSRKVRFQKFINEFKNVMLKSVKKSYVSYK